MPRPCPDVRTLLQFKRYAYPAISCCRPGLKNSVHDLALYEQVYRRVAAPGYSSDLLDPSGAVKENVKDYLIPELFACQRPFQVREIGLKKQGVAIFQAYFNFPGCMR